MRCLGENDRGGDAICKILQGKLYSTTTILWSLVELQRTVIWKNRVGKRFKERGQGLRRGMQCGGTRVRTRSGRGI